MANIVIIKKIRIFAKSISITEFSFFHNLEKLDQFFVGLPSQRKNSLSQMEIDVSTYFTALAFFIPILILATNWLIEYTGIRSNKRKREEAYSSFEKVVENLSADNPASQLSAAVLLRRYLSLKIGKSRHSCISPWQYNHVIQRS